MSGMQAETGAREKAGAAANMGAVQEPANAESGGELENKAFPLIALAIPLVFAQLVGTRHMKGQILKLLRDPHVWLPWINRSPWKNPTSQWWFAKKQWSNKEPWKNPKPWSPAAAAKKKTLF
jgi:hypothetical protein